MKKALSLAAAALLACTAALGQSGNFTLGQWVEIHNAVLAELSRSYVDSLPVGRISRAGMDAMLEDLDPYTMYIPEEENEDLQMMISKVYGGIGAVIYKPDVNGNVIIDEPYAGSPAAEAGLLCGDEILEIDGVSTHGLTATQSSDRMKGKPGTTVRFLVKRVRGGAIETIDITRRRIHLPDVEYAGMINDTTGYILQTGFTENVSSDVRAAVVRLKAQGMKQLVLDLRGNGGGLMSEAVGIVSIFVPKGSLVVTQKGVGASSDESRTKLEPVDTELPLIVLVDGGTASSSEIVSGALQDLDRATIMGRRTYGKGLVQSIRPLPYGGQLKVTVAKYYTPSGRCVQAIDYAARAEDGSVSHIPDSLTHEFKTLHGRTVRDGGGITPDHELSIHNYSRLTYSLVRNGVINHYAIKYFTEHPEIASAEDFRFTDYDDFVAYALGQDFDYRSSSKAIFDQMKKEMVLDGLSESAKAEIEALDKAVNLGKEEYLRLKKDEIVPFIEEEILARYYFQEAGISARLRYDEQLVEALGKPLISF